MKFFVDRDGLRYNSQHIECFYAINLGERVMVYMTGGSDVIPVHYVEQVPWKYDDFVTAFGIEVL